jgi:hypothetical protein
MYSKGQENNMEGKAASLECSESVVRAHHRVSGRRCFDTLYSYSMDEYDPQGKSAEYAYPAVEPPRFPRDVNDAVSIFPRTQHGARCLLVAAFNRVRSTTFSVCTWYGESTHTRMYKSIRIRLGPPLQRLREGQAQPQPQSQSQSQPRHRRA